MRVIASLLLVMIPNLLVAQDPEKGEEMIKFSVIKGRGAPARVLLNFAGKILDVPVKTAHGLPDTNIRFVNLLEFNRSDTLNVFRALARLHGLDLRLRNKGRKRFLQVRPIPAPKHFNLRQLHIYSINQLLKAKLDTPPEGTPATTSLALRQAKASRIQTLLRGSPLGKGLRMVATTDEHGLILQGPVETLRSVLRQRSLLDVPLAAPALRIARGFQFTEGPVWHPQGHLLFTDIRASRIHLFDPAAPPGDRVSVYLEPSQRANGLALDPQGNLLVCQGGARQVLRIRPDSSREVLAARYRGRRLNSPNDLALDDAGGIYFTDPRYGKQDDREIEVMGVYYRDASGQLHRVINKQRRPNGIVFDAIRKRLLVAEPSKRQILSYPVLGPGKLGPAKILFTAERSIDGAGPDGMCLDVQGTVYATYRAVLAIDTKGQLLQRIPVTEQPSNCCLGGKDQELLFITARTGLYQHRLSK